MRSSWAATKSERKSPRRLPKDLSHLLACADHPNVPVFRSPLNEDVFAAPPGYESRVTTPDVIQLSEQIHRILAQPVHNGGSQGYSSLGSSGSRDSRRSHQQHLSAASSSDSNGPVMDEAAAVVALHKPVSPARPKDVEPRNVRRRSPEGHVQLSLPQMTFQQICKDVHMVKTNGQQMFIESRNRPPARKNSAGRRKDRDNTSPANVQRLDDSALSAQGPPTSQRFPATESEA